MSGDAAIDLNAILPDYCFAHVSWDTPGNRFFFLNRDEQRPDTLFLLEYRQLVTGNQMLNIGVFFSFFFHVLCLHMCNSLGYDRNIGV